MARLVDRERRRFGGVIRQNQSAVADRESILVLVRLFEIDENTSVCAGLPVRAGAAGTVGTVLGAIDRCLATACCSVVGE